MFKRYTHFIFFLITLIYKYNKALGKYAWLVKKKNGKMYSKTKDFPPSNGSFGSTARNKHKSKYHCEDIEPLIRRKSGINNRRKTKTYRKPSEEAEKQTHRDETE